MVRPTKEPFSWSVALSPIGLLKSSVRLLSEFVLEDHYLYAGPFAFITLYRTGPGGTLCASVGVCGRYIDILSIPTREER